MLGIAKRLHELLADKIGISEGFGGFVYAVIVCAVMIMVEWVSTGYCRRHSDGYQERVQD